MFGLTVGFGYSVVAAISGYAFTSLLLLHYPEILHKKKKQHFHSAHISHRGGTVIKVYIIDLTNFINLQSWFCFYVC